MLQLINDSTARPRLDERRHLITASEEALSARVLPLAALRTPAPGAYLLLYRGTNEIYQPITYRGAGGSIVEEGGYPIYAGSAVSLRERRRRHQRNLVGLRDLAEDDLRIVAVSTLSKAGAVYLEQLFIDAFRPVWNEPWLAGFGSKRQGRTREQGQRVSPWNVLHPGRFVDHRAPRPTVTRDQLHRRVADHLTSTVSAAFRS